MTTAAATMHVERPAFAPNASLGRSRESMANSTSGVFEEEKTGVIKSGTVLGGFIPFKGRSKCTSMYVVLSERAMEVYKNEQAYIEKTLPKHTIDLAIAFNVHNDHYDQRLNRCVCVMRPDDTFVFKAENEEANREWFESILGTAVPSRALRLGRFATPHEFFEGAYDVTIVDTPKKIACKRGEEKPVDNILKRYPSLQGPRRLCFYTHMLYLCHKNIEPAKEDDLPPAGIPPFKPKDFFEIQRRHIPNFGQRKHYFVMQMGRSSPTGTCELWCEMECKPVATHIFHFLNNIIDRDVQRKKELSNGAPLVTPAPPTMPKAHHRTRSNTQPHRQRLPIEIIARNTNSPLAALAKKPSTGTAACIAGCNRLPPTKLGDASTSSSSLPVPGTRHSFAAPSSVRDKLLPNASIFPARSQSDTIKEVKEEASSYQPMDPRDEARKKEWEQMMRGEVKGCRPVSPSTTRSSADETEDSGGTLRCYGETEDSGGTLKMGVDSRPHSPQPPGSIRNLSLTQLPPERPRPQQYVPINQNKADHLSSSEDDADADVISAGTNTSTGGESISAGELDYSHMDVVNWNAEGSSLSVPLYKLNTPRSFVSSSDSCYSSMAERQQRGELAPSVVHHEAPPAQFRTYSFGPGHPSYQRPSDMTPCLKPTGLTSAERLAASEAAAAEAAASSTTAKEEARKRAFSLGSKNFFAYCSRPFRKVSARARQSATSASGVSLASSTISSAGGPPSSSSSNHLASVPGGAASGAGGDKDDQYRNRSGSFGSGRSTPYSRRSGGGTATDASRDHLMELDFGGGDGKYTSSHHGLGRCGSGSMGSVDSPSRSRTSSFGCQIKRDDRDTEPEHNGLTPSQILLQKAKQLSVDAENAHDDSDYVITEAPSAVAAAAASMTSPRLPQMMMPASLSLSSAAMMHHGHHYQHHQPQHHSPEHGMPPPSVQQIYPGGVLDVMGKAHDARSSQYFETIEETTSGRSSRASSVGDDDEADVITRATVHMKEEDEDEYAVMDMGGGGVKEEQQQPATVPSPPTVEVPKAEATVPAVATAPQLQPAAVAADSRHNSSRSRSASPAAQSRRADSSSTLQSIVSSASTDRSDRENREEMSGEGATAATEKLQQPQPLRQKISTQSEGPPPSLLLGSLPKRASVPVLKDQDVVGAGGGAAGDAAACAAAAAAPGTPLNYAYLQLSLNGLPPVPTHDPAAASRVRSKSGIVFKESTPTVTGGATVPPPPQKMKQPLL